MTGVWLIASLWLGLALMATVVSIRFRIATSLSEIVVGTVIALGLIFSPFTIRTAVFVGVSVVVFGATPFLTPWFFQRYGNRPLELEAKYLLLVLFGMGALATCPTCSRRVTRSDGWSARTT